MDFFDNRYYRINKVLLSAVGLWPFQRTSTKRFTQAFGVYGCATICFPQILYMMKIKFDMDKLIASAPTFFGGILVSAKIFTMIRNSAEFKTLLNHIRGDWQTVTADTEKWILHKYARNGRKFTIFYSTLFSIPTSCFLLWPIVPTILDIILPMNESRARDLPYSVDFPVDEEKYYYVILLSEYVAYLALVPILVGSDITYMACAQHVCGMFAVLSHRLENSMPKVFNRLNDPDFDSDKYFHSQVISCIRLHIKTIIFVELMASVFSTFLLVDISLGLIMHCAGCILIVVRVNQTSQVILCGAIVCTQSIRMYFNCRPGQQIMDHSIEVANAAYNAMWYNMSTKTRKLLVFIIMRGQMACMFVVAKLYVVNLNSFGVIIKTSLSYCTVMASVHDASYIADD